MTDNPFFCSKCDTIYEECCTCANRHLEETIRNMTRLELFTMGWDFRNALIGGVNDGRDLRRALMSNKHLDELGQLIDGHHIEDAHKNAVRIKKFINKTLKKQGRR